MRAYLPLAPDELSDVKPPKRQVIKAVVPLEARPDDRETILEDALDEASFASLQLMQEAVIAGPRVVAAGDLPDNAAFFEAWEQIDSLMADGREGLEIVRQILNSRGEEDANTLVETLFDEPLEWYDITERTRLSEPMTPNATEN